MRHRNFKNLFCLTNAFKARSLYLFIAFLLSINFSHGNDTTAAIAAGGLELQRTEQIKMQSEYLFISEKKIEVKYTFLNTSNENITTLVAFPMPELEYSEGAEFIFDDDSVNYMKFSVKVDGLTITPEHEAKAFLDGQEITKRLIDLKIPLNPMTQTTLDALEALPTEQKKALIADKIILEYDGYVPAWKLNSTYFWNQTFLTGKKLNVEHRYTPAVGGISGSGFLMDESMPPHQESIENFCVDKNFIAAAKKLQKSNKNAFEKWIDYILVTGGNWAGGEIGDFRLVIDKGAPENLVSFCMDGVKKITPTQFEVRKKNFKPAHNLNILILVPYVE